MPLPPNDLLLQPPRRSIDGIQWSREAGGRQCLIAAARVEALWKNKPSLREQQMMQAQSGSQSARAAFVSAREEPTRSLRSRRNSALHVPICVLPKADVSDRPWVLSARDMGSLARNKADALRVERYQRTIMQYRESREAAMHNGKRERRPSADLLESLASALSSYQGQKPEISRAATTEEVVAAPIAPLPAPRFQVRRGRTRSATLPPINLGVLMESPDRPTSGRPASASPESPTKRSRGLTPAPEE